MEELIHIYVYVYIYIHISDNVIMILVKTFETINMGPKSCDKNALYLTTVT